MAGAKIALTGVAGELQNDGNGNAQVNLPLAATEAGFASISFDKTRAAQGLARVARVTAEGELRAGHSTRLFDSEFNGPSGANALNNQWNTQLTTMTAVHGGGFLRLNQGASAAINVGASIFSFPVFPIHDQSTLRLSGVIRTVNGSVANKQFDFGFGFYDVAANQNAAMNEFAGIRWTQAGALIGVLEYSVGGAATTVTVNLNGGVPLSDNVTHYYDIFLNKDNVEFWLDGSYAGQILAQPDAPGVLKSSGLPVIARLFNGVAPPSLAPLIDIGGVTVSRIGPLQQEDRAVLQVMQGRHSGRAQSGVQSTLGSTGNVPASGTAPGPLAASNTVSGLVGLGGYGRVTLTGVVAAAHTELIMNSFQNPAVPETLGVGNNGRALIITDILISPLIVTTVLAGGGFTAEWFLAHGANALSLATADATGGANPGTKSASKMPLPIFDTLPATAAAGTIATRTGHQGLISLQTPIVINPGEFIHVGLRTLQVTAAVTAGAVDFGIGFSGYWQ